MRGKTEPKTPTKTNLNIETSASIVKKIFNLDRLPI